MHVGLAALIVQLSLGFTPPVDTSGPLEVRIEGPATCTAVGVPQVYRVVLENRGDNELRGDVQIRVIDRWQADPAQSTGITLPPRKKHTLEVRVTAEDPTYNRCDYPIHALANFAGGGQTHAAHPILIVQTELAKAAAVEPALSFPWKPFAPAKQGALGLRWLPIRRAVVLPDGKPPITMPVGWSGSEPASKGSLGTQAVTLDSQTREALVMHPPWADGYIGAIVAEFPLELPAAAPLRLDFSNAMQTDGHSDGVTFRVRVLPFDAPDAALGQVLFERHTAAKQWQVGSADLAAFAGKQVRLQLESHPGPQKNTGWDQSYWGDVVLTSGNPPPERPFPPQDVAGAELLGTLPLGDDHAQVYLWPGQRGLLDAIVGFQAQGKLLCFQGFDVRSLQNRLSDPRSPLVLQQALSEPCPQGRQVRHIFASPLGAFELVVQLWLDRQALRVKFDLAKAPPPQPWRVAYLEDVALGPWSQVAAQVHAGAGNTLRQPHEFNLGFDGHRLATSFVGLDFANGLSMVLGTDLTPQGFTVRPAERHYSLHVPHGPTLSLIPCTTAWEGARRWRDVNGLRAGPGVSKAAGRFVFDLWGGRYGESADTLKRAFRYGLTDSLVVWHNWQRWGYDYRLPEIFPPNPQLGTLADMQRLADVCKSAGVPFAPHDNYIDYYPDAEDFSYPRRICFARPQTPVKAWLNEGRKAQSYRYRADQIEPLLQRNVDLIRQNFSATAYFIDVWSSAPPYDFWTADGQFFPRTYTRDVWARSFDWIRERLGDNAPQISESGHDGLIGSLDGAQTNHLRVDRPPEGYFKWAVWNILCEDSERTPWFDAAHHDRFILHGAGYPGRYEGGLDARQHGIYSDDYITTEVLTGHPAMVPNAFSPEVVRKYWLLHGVGRALALRTIERVEFAENDLHRQHVVWSGGGEVWVNRGSSDWNVAGVTLPQYGFLARIATAEGPVEAALVRRAGQIVEWAHGPGEHYVNGRLPLVHARQIRLSLKSIQRSGPKKFHLALHWQADDEIPAGWRPFLHLVEAGGRIIVQAHHQPAEFDTPRQGAFEATAELELPEKWSDGATLELRYGLYQAEGGQRMALVGADDGERRIRLGSFRRGNNDPAELPWTPRTPGDDPYLARFNTAGTPVDFGMLHTAGGCRLTRDQSALMVTPLPQTPGKRFVADLDWSALPWKLPPATQVELLHEDGHVLGRSPLRREGQRIIVECPAHAFACRLTP